MLTREAAAAALALAGIRTGALVLDLTPSAGLGGAARAMVGEGGRVDDVLAGSASAISYGYAIGVWSDRSADVVAGDAEASRKKLAANARVTLGCEGSLAALVNRLRANGWTVLHGTTVTDADTSLTPGSHLALAVARVPG